MCVDRPLAKYSAFHGAEKFGEQERPCAATLFFNMLWREFGIGGQTDGPSLTLHGNAQIKRAGEFGEVNRVRLQHGQQPPSRLHLGDAPALGQSRPE